MYQVIANTIHFAAPTMALREKKILRNESLGQNNFFEILGVDMMLNEQMECFLLECNMSPSLETRTHQVFQVKYPIFKDLSKIVLDFDGTIASIKSDQVHLLIPSFPSDEAIPCSLD